MAQYSQKVHLAHSDPAWNMVHPGADIPSEGEEIHESNAWRIMTRQLTQALQETEKEPYLEACGLLSFPI